MGGVSPPLVPMENYDVSNNPNCMAHGEGLARIEKALEAINERLDRLNGSVARHEGSIVAINLRDAEQRGRRGGINMIAVWAVTLLGVVFAGWQSNSAYQQTAAALAQMNQTAQHQR